MVKNPTTPAGGKKPKKRYPKRPKDVPPKANGRPPHVPSAQTRDQVTFMAGIGIKQHDIARIIGVSQLTLAKHYRTELDMAAPMVEAKVATNLLALSKTNVAAGIFLLKARFGWRERIDVNQTINHDFSKYTDAELRVIARFFGVPENGGQPDAIGDESGAGSPSLQ